MARYPIALCRHTALYTVILNLAVAVVLTPVFNAMTRKASDDSVTADYSA